MTVPVVFRGFISSSNHPVELPTLNLEVIPRVGEYISFWGPDPSKDKPQYSGEVASVRHQLNCTASEGEGHAITVLVDLDED